MNDDVEHSGRHGIRNRKRNDGQENTGLFAMRLFKHGKKKRERTKTQILVSHM